MVIGGAVAGLVTAGAVVGVSFDLAGLARTSLDLVLLAVAVGGVSATAVAMLDGMAAIAALTGWIVAAYLVMLRAPLFDWPEWVPRLSLFDAYGRPYLAMPDAFAITYLVSLAIAGAAISVSVLGRRRAA